jgi:hypothetical protein
MSGKLREEFIELLEKDREFRYIVAGFLGLDEVLKKLDSHGAELVKLREEMNKLREDTNRLSEEMNRLREDTNKLREDMNKLREDMNKGFDRLERHLTALGARWGIMSEEAFREGIRGLLGRELGFRIERWEGFDEEGVVYGYPSSVNLDVTIYDGKTILLEVKSHVRKSDVTEFRRKAELYEARTSMRPDRLIIVTPYAEVEAREACLKLGVELYTSV